jgi:hypothetical protein
LGVRVVVKQVYEKATVVDEQERSVRLVVKELLLPQPVEIVSCPTVELRLRPAPCIVTGRDEWRGKESVSMGVTARDEKMEKRVLG